MTNKSQLFEQKRIDNVAWSGVSRLPSLPSLTTDGNSPAMKTPLFYLTTVSVNNYEDDVYFVNNTDETLSFVALFKLYQNVNQAGVTLGDISDSNVHKAKLYANDMDRVYTTVLPNQGVRIGSVHIIYDSDELMQWFIQVPFKGVDTHYGIWRFNVVEKGGIGESYPLLWEDFGKPSHMVSCHYAAERADMPIEPCVYEERCWVFDGLIESVGVADAIFILAINDVLYRYGVGWNAPYNESDIQAKAIAHKLNALKPKEVGAIKAIIQDVYDFWFGEGFARTVSPQACAEVLALSQAQVGNH